MSQAVSASQVRSQTANTATGKADGGSKVRETATEAHLAIWVRKEMVKVPTDEAKVRSAADTGANQATG